ncbi:homoserine O-acetyltransferase MetX [Arcobacter porcinus]|uniref:Homoserine O-acetyltransferase n=1 Tax=Arcobacter porcinus TaxID=1935204 RepID=A0A5C2HD99_9BACT|nr:homoserine O-acetyltransferase [Arcobacter porcinus]OCL86239.1 Homoserine O-acetyltransferase [Arcobacter porcinus]OCL94212.1 Homoserine O-acetyltransferase [Aliarcobacter thereius]QEP40916.1 homoserine O-acetyltransferase [Arcobacter porcinus]
MKIETKIASFDEPLYLESGRLLEKFEIIYETYGTLNEDKSNVIVICHALSGSHHAAGRYENEAKAGWWDKFIGDKKTIDTEKYFVICSNNIGSSYGSTSPLSINPATKKEYRLKFPVLTISDIVNAQMKLYKKLGIEKALAVIGGSMGGMQTLCYSIEHPSFAKHYIAMACTAYTRPWAVALNKIAIEAIRHDPSFKNGNYEKDDLKAKGLVGLAVGRMAGLIAYLSPSFFNRRFGRDYVDTDGLYELFGRFEIEKYLEHNSYSFPKFFDPLSYLYICKTINIFDAGRNKDKLEYSFMKILGKLHLISFKDDMLFFPSEMKEIEDIMIKIGKQNQVTYLEVDSSSGHDSFLVEVPKFEKHIQEILKD